MTQEIEVLEFLDDIKPRAECDDCLSAELDIRPRQTVNQICRALAAAKKIARLRSRCGRCGNLKLTNAYREADAPVPVHRTSDSVVRAATAIKSPGEPPLDIEKTRTEIVRICRALWQKAKSEEPPRSLGTIIHTLRNEGAIPNHLANLMQTLCNLRNAHVYEELEMGARENAIATNARNIVLDWWDLQVGESHKV